MTSAGSSAAPPLAQPYYFPTLIAAIAASAGVIIGSLGTWAHFITSPFSGIGDSGQGTGMPSFRFDPEGY
jgi:hypothetical protein